jgi:hypothetical protein
MCYEVLARIGGGSFGRVFLARGCPQGRGEAKGRIITVVGNGLDPDTASCSSDTSSVASATPPSSPTSSAGMGGDAGGLLKPCLSFAIASSPSRSFRSGGSSSGGSCAGEDTAAQTEPPGASRAAAAARQPTGGADLFAIKLLRRSAISKHTLAEISNQLQQLHPHITTMHQVLLTRNHIAMVLDYANGGRQLAPAACRHLGALRASQLHQGAAQQVLAVRL